MKVPDDVSIIGFDDALAARYALVPLTIVSYPLETIGRHVVEFTQNRRVQRIDYAKQQCAIKLHATCYNQMSFNT